MHLLFTPQNISVHGTIHDLFLTETMDLILSPKKSVMFSYSEMHSNSKL